MASVEASAGQRIALARFSAYGKSTFPDATTTLRVTYGTVKGYEEDTTLVPFKTTFYGLYDRAESFGEKPPYDLPPGETLASHLRALTLAGLPTDRFLFLGFLPAKVKARAAAMVIISLVSRYWSCSAHSDR